MTGNTNASVTAKKRVLTRHESPRYSAPIVEASSLALQAFEDARR